MESFRPFPGVIHRHGHGSNGGQIFLTDDQVAWMREGSKVLKRSELAAMMGISISSFGHLKTRLGLKGINPDHPGHARTRYFDEHPDAKKKMYEKAAATRRKMIRRERFNIRMGLHQETRIRIYQHPYTQKQKALRFRGRKMGYRTLSYLLEGDPRRWIIYYDEGMHRHTVYERHAERLGFSFRPSSEMFPWRNTGTASVMPRSMSDWML